MLEITNVGLFEKTMIAVEEYKQNKIKMEELNITLLEYMFLTSKLTKEINSIYEDIGQGGIR